MRKSEFKFSPHKPADGERSQHGLVDVYDRETGAHLGMLNPLRGGGYVLRDRTGERLGENNCGHIEDVVYLSRETSARILRRRIEQHDRLAARRVGTVSEGCPNDWHNTGEYKAATPCPECPTQAGLKLAVAVLEAGPHHFEDVAQLRALIYTPTN